MLLLRSKTCKAELFRRMHGGRFVIEFWAMFTLVSAGMPAKKLASNPVTPAETNSKPVSCVRFANVDELSTPRPV